MVSEAKKNADIERVCHVFEDYIKASPYIDWLWSDKLGYILTQISVESQEIMESRVITDAGKLCWILFNEVADDVLKMTQNDHTAYEAGPLEQAEIRKRLKPYADQLPEFSGLCDRLFVQ